MNEETKVYIFRPDKAAGMSFTRGLSVVVGLFAPAYLYVAEDVRNIYFLVGFAAFAALIPFAMRGLRSLAGGIEALAISEESIELIKKKDSETILWVDMAEVEFERVNDLPWILLVTNEKKKHRICLDDFGEGDRNKIHELIAGEVWDITKEKTTWIIANRLSFSYSQNRVKDQSDTRS